MFVTSVRDSQQSSDELRFVLALRFDRHDRKRVDAISRRGEEKRIARPPEAGEQFRQGLIKIAATGAVTSGHQEVVLPLTKASRRRCIAVMRIQ